jgi:hypothetical protein
MLGIASARTLAGTYVVPQGCGRAVEHGIGVATNILAAQCGDRLGEQLAQRSHDFVTR